MRNPRARDPRARGHPGVGEDSRVRDPRVGDPRGGTGWHFSCPARQHRCSSSRTMLESRAGRRERGDSRGFAKTLSFTKTWSKFYKVRVIPPKHSPLPASPLTGPAGGESQGVQPATFTTGLSTPTTTSPTSLFQRHESTRHHFCWDSIFLNNECKEAALRWISPNKSWVKHREIGTAALTLGLERTRGLWSTSRQILESHGYSL